MAMIAIWDSSEWRSSNKQKKSKGSLKFPECETGCLLQGQHIDCLLQNEAGSLPYIRRNQGMDDAEQMKIQ